jgi:TolB protein
MNPLRPLLLPLVTTLFLSASITAFPADDLVIEKDVDASKLIPISLTGFSGEVQAVLKFYLYVAGFTNVSQEVAQFLITGSNNDHVEGRVTDRLNKATLLSVRYADASLRTQAHTFADEIVLKLTGKPGIARTKIAFKGQRGSNTEIYISDYDGFNAVPITTDRALVRAPCWVPGRRMLYYTSYKSGFPDIYSQDLASGQRKVIANFSGLNSSPAISPDGRRVAMILSKDGNTELYVSDAVGGAPKRLTHTKADVSSPCWSPDGTTICVVSAKEGTPQLYLVPGNGGSMQRLRTAGVPRSTEPDWSPDGKWIAFTTMQRDFSICRVPAQGGAAEVLASGEDPSWAPNSRTIIFSRSVKGRHTLSLLDVLSKRVKDVAENSGSNSQPSWAK